MQGYHRFKLGPYDHLCFECPLSDCLGLRHPGCLIRQARRKALATEEVRATEPDPASAAGTAPVALSRSAHNKLWR